MSQPSLIANYISGKSDADIDRLTGTQAAQFSSNQHAAYKAVQNDAFVGALAAIGADKMNFRGVLSNVSNNYASATQINPLVDGNQVNLQVGDFWHVDTVSVGDAGQVTWFTNGSASGTIVTVHPGDNVVQNGTTLVTFAARISDQYNASADILFTETAVQGGRNIQINLTNAIDTVESVDQALVNVAQMQTQSAKHLVKIGEYLQQLEATIHVTQANAEVTPNVAAFPFDPFATGPSIADIKGNSGTFTSTFVSS